MMVNIYNANMRYTCTQSKDAQVNAETRFVYTKKERTAFFFFLKMYTCTQKKEIEMLPDTGEAEEAGLQEHINADVLTEPKSSETSYSRFCIMDCIWSLVRRKAAGKVDHSHPHNKKGGTSL